MLLNGSKAMLKFFKKVFGSSTAEDHANGNGYATPYATAEEQANSGAVATAYGTPSSAYGTSPAMASHQYGQGGGIRVSLPSIIAVLPMELKTRIKQTMVAGMYITLPMGHVLAQLAAGAVRMTFGEIRAAAPNVFAPQADRDAVQITLPLHEILQQVPPEYLPRRQSQKQIAIPEDVRGPFGNDGFGVTFADTKTITGTQIGQTPTAHTPPSAPVQPAQPIQQAQPIQPLRPTQPIQPLRPTAPAPTPDPIQFRPPVPPANFKPPVPPAAPKPPAPPASLKPPGPGIPTHGSFGAPQPQAPQSPRPVQPLRPTPPATPANTGAPNPTAPRPPVPLRGTFSSTPTPPPPTATPSAFPPVRPAFPTARGAGATDSPPAVPRMPASGSNGNGHAPAAQPAPVPQPATPASDICIDVPMAVLSESWPEALRGEIEQLNLSRAHLALPMRVVDPALRQGKIAFTWKVLRSWIRPAILPTVSAHDGVLLELPLQVIAPLFIAKQKQTSFYRKEKVAVDENIPNLFFGFPQPDSEEPVAEEPVAEEPIAPPPIALPPIAPPPPAPAKPERAATETSAIFSPAPKLKPAGVPDTNYYVWGDSADTPRVDETEFKRKSSGGTEFMARYATPNEVVSRAAALDGVAGALVALPDGLMVASKLSADLNGDTLAAFLPHIFGKVSQCTKELRMGELNNLHFTVGNVPWKIFRVNAIFFAVFGRAGQPLPTVQLATLAGELDRKK